MLYVPVPRNRAGFSGPGHSKGRWCGTFPSALPFHRTTTLSRVLRYIAALSRIWATTWPPGQNLVLFVNQVPASVKILLPWTGMKVTLQRSLPCGRVCIARLLPEPGTITCRSRKPSLRSYSIQHYIRFYPPKPGLLQIHFIRQDISACFYRIARQNFLWHLKISRSL